MFNDASRILNLHLTTQFKEIVVLKILVYFEAIIIFKFHDLEFMDNIWTSPGLHFWLVNSQITDNTLKEWSKEDVIF